MWKRCPFKIMMDNFTCHVYVSPASEYFRCYRPALFPRNSPTFNRSFPVLSAWWIWALHARANAALLCICTSRNRTAYLLTTLYNILHLFRELSEIKLQWLLSLGIGRLHKEIGLHVVPNDITMWPTFETCKFYMTPNVNSHAVFSSIIASTFCWCMQVHHLVSILL